MSFGYSISDVVFLSNLAWKTYNSCKEAPDSFANVRQETLSLHAVLKETEEVLSECNLTPAQQQRLHTLCDGCKSVLEDLDGLIQKYQNLGTNSQRTWDRLKWGMENTNDLRNRLVSNTTLLSGFLLSTQIVVEQKLRKLLTEFQQGRREVSLFSIQTVDSISVNERRQWRDIRKGLEEIDITLDAFNANKSFILSFLRGAVASGALEEDDKYEGPEAAISVPGSPPDNTIANTSKEQHFSDINKPLRKPVISRSFHLSWPFDRRQSGSTITNKPYHEEQSALLATTSLDEKQPLHTLLHRLSDEDELVPTSSRERSDENQSRLHLKKAFRRSISTPSKDKHISTTAMRLLKIGLQGGHEPLASSSEVEIQDEPCRIVLLGAGDSGKTSVMKQFQMSYVDDAFRNDMTDWKGVLWSNLVTALKHLPDEEDHRNLKFEDDETVVFFNADTGVSSLAEELESMRFLWHETHVQNLLARVKSVASSEIAASDNVEYIYTNLPRLMFPNNSIHHSDILQARVKTTGITRTPLQWSSQVFEIVDTGGERAERKKWPHIFNVAHCVLFVVALNGYSKSLAEDIHAIQMWESLMLFESLMGLFKDGKKCIVLIMNKLDLFKNMLQLHPIKDRFPDFEGAVDGDAGYHQGLKFFTDKFLALKQGSQRIHVHSMNACDTTLNARCLDRILAYNSDRLKRPVNSLGSWEPAMEAGCCELSLWK